MNTTVPLRLVAVAPPGRLGAQVLDRGGRCFEVRHAGAALDGDLIVALPRPEPGARPAASPSAGGREVIVPQGLGRPLLARPTLTRSGTPGWAVDGTGEECSPRRWVAVGGLAARVRTVRLALGPAAAVGALGAAPSSPEQATGPAPLGAASPGGSPEASPGPWLAVRVQAPGWVAACWRDPSLGRGPVAVLGTGRRARRVGSVSPDARARGVVPGMALSLARRRCPDLRAVDHPGHDVVHELGRLLGREVGPVSTVGRALLVQLRPGTAAQHVALAEALVVRAWQSLGTHLRVAVASCPDTAARVAHLLDAQQVAYVPLGAGAAWRRRARRALRRGSGRVRWSGQPVVDVEGIVALARAVVDGVNTGGRLHLAGPAGNYVVRCAAGNVPAQVESALRARGPRLEATTRVEWRAGPRASGEQVPLLDGLRLAR